MNTEEINAKIRKKVGKDWFELLGYHRFYVDLVYNQEFLKMELLPLLGFPSSLRSPIKVVSLNKLYHTLILAFWARYLVEVIGRKGSKYVDIRLLDCLLGYNAYNTDGFARRKQSEYEKFIGLVRYGEEIKILDSFLYFDRTATKYFDRAIYHKSICLTDLGFEVLNRIKNRYEALQKKPVLPPKMFTPLPFFFHKQDANKNKKFFRKD